MLLTHHGWPGTSTTGLVLVAGRGFVGQCQMHKDREGTDVHMANVESESS